MYHLNNGYYVKRTFFFMKFKIPTDYTKMADFV